MAGREPERRPLGPPPVRLHLAHPHAGGGAAARGTAVPAGGHAQVPRVLEGGGGAAGGDARAWPPAGAQVGNGGKRGRRRDQVMEVERVGWPWGGEGWRDGAGCQAGCCALHAGPAPHPPALPSPLRPTHPPPTSHPLSNTSRSRRACGPPRRSLSCNASFTHRRCGVRLLDRMFAAWVQRVLRRRRVQAALCAALGGATRRALLLWHR